MEELAPRLIDAFVRMGAEEVALSLQQVRGQARGAVSVVEGERRRHRRSRHAVLDGLNERASPRCLILVQQLAEKIVQQKIGELRILVVSLLDLSEEPAADDAARSEERRVGK